MTVFGKKIAKIEKSRFSGILGKYEIIQVQSDIESWNLANLCTIVLSNEWARDFWYFMYFLKVWQICRKFDHFFKILTKFLTNFAKYQKIHEILKNEVITF